VKVAGRSFYNTSNYGFANLLADADGVADNLTDYVDRFSADVDVFEYFDFKKEILALEKAGLLREIVKSFGAVDLHPPRRGQGADCGSRCVRRVAPSARDGFQQGRNEETGHPVPRRDRRRSELRRSHGGTSVAGHGHGGTASGDLLRPQ
jgi:hypothetical protein